MPPPSDSQDNSAGENHRGPGALEPTIPQGNIESPSVFQATTSKSQQHLAEISASPSKSQQGLAETGDSLRIAQEVEQQQTGLIIIPEPSSRQQYYRYEGRICIKVGQQLTPINCSPLNTVFVKPPVRNNMGRNAVFTEYRCPN